MLLHDAALLAAIKCGSLLVEPFDERALQPSSIDLRLGSEFAVLTPGDYIDVREDNSQAVDRVTIPDGQFMQIEPGELVLATTAERIGLCGAMAGRVEGKSSLGRLGLVVHSTAGFIDPGFRGQVTLELAVMGRTPIRVYPGMPVAQLAVFLMAGRADRLYDGKYTDQTGPTASRYHLNFEKHDLLVDDKPVAAHYAPVLKEIASRCEE